MTFPLISDWPSWAQFLLALWLVTLSFVVMVMAVTVWDLRQSVVHMRRESIRRSLDETREYSNRRHTSDTELRQSDVSPSSTDEFLARLQGQYRVPPAIDYNGHDHSSSDGRGTEDDGGESRDSRPEDLFPGFFPASEAVDGELGNNLARPGTGQIYRRYRSPSVPGIYNLRDLEEIDGDIDAGTDGDSDGGGDSGSPESAAGTD